MFTYAAFRLFDTTYPAYCVFVLLLTAIAMFGSAARRAGSHARWA